MWDHLNESLAESRSRGRYRELIPRSVDGVYLTEPDGRRLVNFGSNDYLGFSSYVASQTTASAIVGAKASGLVCGWTDRHQVLARMIAELESTDTAVVFPSGFAACSGTVATLCRDGDLILSDELNHASLIDGCRLSEARRIIYPHRDVAAVEHLLRQQSGHARQTWILTDSVFSMDGHVAPLPELCDLADQFDATVIVDEAHATGVLGDSKSGACEALGVKQRVPIRIGTLSKAMGSQGGFVACPREVADFLVNRCRPLIFSTALSLPAVESSIVALANPDEMRRRSDRVTSMARTVRTALQLSGDSIEQEVPIIPIVIGSDRDTVLASRRMRALGMFVPAIRPPTVPDGTARLRVSLSADHSDEMIQRLVESLHSL